MNALCYDHREDQGKSPTAAKWRALLSKLGANTSSRPPYDIVVAHGTPEKARYLIRKKPLQSDVTEHHYVLICGTEGVRDHPPCSFNVGRKVVLVFPVTEECDAISLGEWRLLFEWLVTMVNKKCSSLDEASGLAESRILPLIGLVDQTIPSTFSILCQGYLATCAEGLTDEPQ